MSERRVETKTRPPLPRKRPSSVSKTERWRPETTSTSGPSQMLADDLLAKEEQYKLLNAELEAKTADVVRQAEQLMKDQSDLLSKPLSSRLLTHDDHDDEDLRILKHHQSGVKVMTKERLTSKSQNMFPGIQGKEAQCPTTTSKASRVDNSASVETLANCFLADTIRRLEEKMDVGVSHENVEDVCNTGDDVGSGVSEAQVRVLKAKLRIMQEEVDHLSSEYFKKDDENAKLSAKLKETEEDRVKLQKTTSIQQTQIEKHRASAEQSAKKCDGLQLQVSTLNKEIENVNRSHKQAAAVHSSVEVRLNRALEEVERLKTQLNDMKQTNKDKTSEQHQSTEKLLAENKMLKKQKAELVVGFKKQLKLIDILKRQKMHFEAAKLLSFTEDEFMKALDWGKS